MSCIILTEYCNSQEECTAGQICSSGQFCKPLHGKSANTREMGEQENFILIEALKNTLVLIFSYEWRCFFQNVEDVAEY